KMREIHVAKTEKLDGGNVVGQRRVRQNPAVGAAGHRDAAKCIGDAEQLLEGAGHGAPSGAAREHKRAVDIEEDDLDHGRNRFYAAIPTVAFSRSSGRLAANVARARPLRRGLFLEADALAFVQLIEAALHRAPVKEPLLPTV